MSHEDLLTPAERELEAALRSLRPAPAQIGVEAAVHAAAGRSAVLRVSDRKRVWRLAAAAALAAVVGAWALLGLRQHWPHFIQQHLQALEKELSALHNPQKPVAPPTLLAYRQALAQSPAELDALLARQAAAAAAPPPNQFTRVGVVALWNSETSPTSGNM